MQNINEPSSHEQHTSVKAYLLVFVALLILTGTTVLLSYAGLPRKTAITLAALIAFTKVSLIATFFMHLKSESKGIYAVLIAAVFFVVVLALALLPDIGIVK